MNSLSKTETGSVTVRSTDYRDCPVCATWVVVLGDFVSVDHVTASVPLSRVRSIRQTKSLLGSRCYRVRFTTGYRPGITFRGSK